MRFCIGICISTFAQLKSIGVPIEQYFQHFIDPQITFGSSPSHELKILLNPKRLGEIDYLSETETTIKHLIKKIQHFIKRTTPPTILVLLYNALIQSSTHLLEIKRQRPKHRTPYPGLRPDCILSGLIKPKSYTLMSKCCIPHLSDYEILSQKITNQQTTWYIDWDDTLINNDENDIFFPGILHFFQQIRITHQTAILTARSSPFSILNIIQKLLDPHIKDYKKIKVTATIEKIKTIRTNIDKITLSFIESLRTKANSQKNIPPDNKTLVIRLIFLLKSIICHHRNPWQCDEIPNDQTIIFTNEHILLYLQKTYPNPKAAFLSEKHAAMDSEFTLVDDRTDTNSLVNRLGGFAVEPRTLLAYSQWQCPRRTESTATQQQLPLLLNDISQTLSPWIVEIMERKRTKQKTSSHHLPTLLSKSLPLTTPPTRSKIRTITSLPLVANIKR